MHPPHPLRSLNFHSSALAPVQSFLHTHLDNHTCPNCIGYTRPNQSTNYALRKPHFGFALQGRKSSNDSVVISDINVFQRTQGYGGAGLSFLTNKDIECDCYHNTTGHKKSIHVGINGAGQVDKLTVSAPTLGATADAAATVPTCCSGTTVPTCYSAASASAPSPECYTATPGGICGANTVPCPCNIGMFRPSGTPAATVKCQFCPDGTHNDNPGATDKSACVNCPAGTISRPSSACLPDGTCPYNIGCEACPAGQYQPDVGKGECMFCPADTYQPKTGQSGTPCIGCPSGTSTGKATGQTDLSACVSTTCSAGEYISPITNTCQQCPKGSYQPKTGQTLCFDCSAGYITAEAGQTACSPCPVKTYQPSTKQSICFACPSNITTGNWSCTSTTCPAGSFMDSNTQTCSPCQPGYYQQEAGEFLCLQCAHGTYQDKSGQTACLPCPVKTYQPQTKQTSCLACPAGTTSAAGSISAASCT